MTVSDFGYSDADNDTFAGVKITTLETAGTLLYFDGTSWVDVTLNQVITKTEIDNGYLVFKPATNGIGVPYDTFGFEVSDGTAYDSTANTITYNIGNTLNVSNPLPVDEGKSAIFTISLDSTRNSTTLLDLTVGGDVSSTQGTNQATATAADYNTTLYYKNVALDGTWSWVEATGNQVTIATGKTSVEIKVVTLKDSVADNAENLTLTATINGGVNTDMANITATGNTTVNDYPSLVIDTKPYITEGDYAVFELSLSSPKSTSTIVTLGGGGTATMGTDYSQNYEYSTDDGLTWNSISNFSVTIPGSASTTPSVLIRTQTSNDGVAESDETITLVATTTDVEISTKSVNVTTTVIDKVTLNVYENGDDALLSSYSNSVTLTSTSDYTYTIVGQGANGSVTQSGNNLIYTPNTDFSGSDSFGYIKTYTASGLSVTGTADVTVYANADTPIISIDANNKQTSTASSTLINDDLSATNNGTWKDNSGTAVYSSGTSYTLSSSTAIATGINLDPKRFMIKSLSSLSSAGTYSLTFTDTGSGASKAVYFVNLNGSTVTTVATFTLSSGTWTATLPANSTANAIVIANMDTTGNKTVIPDNIVLTSPVTTNYTYNINVSNALIDIDGSESLSNVTISGVPAGATFNSGTNNNDGTWTFTQAQLSGLTITTTSTSFTLTSTVHSIDGSSTSSNITDSITITNTNLLPLIGDQTLMVTNGNANTNGSNIDTTYGDGTNLFSWDASKTQIPELYANGQKVVVTFDNATHTVTGTIDNGATTIFTTTITMAASNGTTLNYTQGSTLLGVANMLDGDIVLPGGGNQDYRIFKFTDSNSSSYVDALVVAHNLIEDTYDEINNTFNTDAEHTVNTNNYYIGVDSNNMNAGQQLIFDFATTSGVYDGGGNTSANQISEMNIKLFNFDSAKSGDELYITVVTIAGRENILLTQNNDYTSELEYTVRSKTGNPITSVEFLAGNSSSFKLGIESIGSISYNDTFQMKFGYDITDATGDSDSGITTITVGNGTVNTSLDYELDSNIVFDSTDKVIDGGAGTDTLILGDGIDIDFDSYTNSIKNIEKIDMTNSSTTNDLSNIKLQDILNITDSNHLLTIFGDGNGATAGVDDTVSLKSETGKIWSLASTDSTYNNYINSGDNSISLKIDKDISVSIV